VRARIELALLGACIAAACVFVASFALGVRLPGADARAASDGPAARPKSSYQDVPQAAGRVEVLNRSRRGGMARLATDRLRDGGFDVVYFGNAPESAPDSSIVIDRVGRPEIARAAAARLGITRTVTQVDTTLYVDATVIIGVEWERRDAGGDSIPSAPPPSGWRDRLWGPLRR
jgi:hypothetical protein